MSETAEATARLPGSPGRDDDPARRLWLQWRKGQRPDVRSFLDQAGPLAPVQMVAVLRVDQRERWRLGERIAAAAYLRDYPGLRADPEVAVELVYCEFLLREELGEAPTLGEYRDAYPEYGPRLELQVGLHLALKPSTELAIAGDSASGSQTFASPEGAAGWEIATYPSVAGYEVLGELGRGGMSVVYRARHLKLHRDVALKMMRFDDHAGSRESARLQAEAEAVACLQHPNIVQVFEVGEQGGRPYVALELVGGGSLAQKLKGTPFPHREAAALVETLARGVHVAHGSGIIHRDLKPSNLLLTVAGVPKIADFGLAKRLEGEPGRSESGAILGTPNYMAPEQAEGRSGEIGPATDVYALGAILYELVTGRPPFGAAAVLDVLEQVRFREPVLPRSLVPKLARDLETICLKCLHKEPRRRYATAEALAEDLHRFLADEPIRARPIGQAERLGRWCRRNAAVAGLLAALALVFVGGFAGVTWQWLRAEQHRRRAESNLDEHRYAVNEFFTKVGAHKLLDQPGLHPLRKELLGDALKYYQRFLRQRGNDPSVRAELAKSYFRMALIVAEMGSNEEALATYEDALELFEMLTRIDPGVPEHRQDVAKILNNIGNLLMHKSGRRADALRAHQRALAIRKRLAAESPSVAEYQVDLARSHYNLGRLQRQAEQLLEALNSYQQALTIQERLVRARPTEAQFLNLAMRRNSLGNLQRELGRKAEALHSHREALAIREKLTTAHPTRREYRRDLAESCYNIGYLLHQPCPTCRNSDANPAGSCSAISALLRRQQANRDEALAYHRRALALREELARENPTVTHYQYEWARSLNIIGSLEIEAGRLAEALRIAQRAHQIWEESRRGAPSDTGSEVGLAMSHNNRGHLSHANGQLADALRNYREALAIRERLVRRDGAITEYRRELAQSYHNIGRIQREMGHFVEALGALKQARDLRLTYTRTNPDDLVNLACGLALCILPGAGSPGGATADRQVESREAANQAIGAIRQAIAHEYEDLEVLVSDADLEPLRSRDDFKALLSALLERANAR